MPVNKDFQKKDFPEITILGRNYGKNTIKPFWNTGHLQPSTFFTMMAAPGRMALTNYISQSLIGILLFYGLGFGLGTRFGLIYIEFAALIVFIVQIVLSRLWLYYFRFGPLEWLWRICTYGKYYPMIFLLRGNNG